MEKHPDEPIEHLEPIEDLEAELDDTDDVKGGAARGEERAYRDKSRNPGANREQRYRPSGGQQGPSGQ